jgi:hypothetical protein
MVTANGDLIVGVSHGAEGRLDQVLLQASRGLGVAKGFWRCFREIDGRVVQPTQTTKAVPQRSQHLRDFMRQYLLSSQDDPIPAEFLDRKRHHPHSHGATDREPL